MPEQDLKREMILDIALKRLAHFGPSKTTMDEIARDLEISKGLLYYYFPDKESICIAAVERVVQTSVNSLQALMKEPLSMDELLEHYLRLKEENYIRYQHLLGILEWSPKGRTCLAQQGLDIFRRAEVGFMAQLISRGIREGEIDEHTDPKLTAEIFFDAMLGLRMMWVKEKCQHFSRIEKRNISVLMRRIRLLQETFFRGLRTAAAASGPAADAKMR
ncbi:TetR/AcrR family transcriptional regulator [Compostibacter hankyongensis]|uniref:HTH tetR-type domain-containing protein n=1 Tax=Compostibacter hankyongensis TaxID=1007089 RepID=A0ABP8FE98_9BACT